MIAQRFAKAHILSSVVWRDLSIRIPGVRMKRVSRLTILAEVEAEEAASPNLEVSP